MRLRHLELFCNDTQVTKRFFLEGLGFELEEEQPGGYVWLLSGPASILLRPNLTSQESPATYQDAAQAIVVCAPSLEEARKRLEENGVPIQGTDGSPDCLTFQDPDGRWYQLIEA